MKYGSTSTGCLNLSCNKEHRQDDTTRYNSVVINLLVRRKHVDVLIENGVEVVAVLTVAR